MPDSDKKSPPSLLLIILTLLGLGVLQVNSGPSAGPARPRSRRATRRPAPRAQPGPEDD